MTKTSRIRCRISLVFIGMLVMSSCGDGEITSLREELEQTRASVQLKAALQDAVTVDNLISRVDSTSEAINFALEDGTVVSADRNLISDVIAKPAEWSIQVHLPATGVLSLAYKGDSIGLSLLPTADTARFPLIQALRASVPFRGRLEYEVAGRSDADGTLRSTRFSVSEVADFVVLGLYPQHDNRVTVKYYSRAGVLRASASVGVRRQTQLSVPNVRLVQGYRDGRQRLFLTAHMSNHHPFIVDHNGDIRWYAAMPGSIALQQVANGNIMFANGDQVYEVSLEGRIVRTYRTPHPYYDAHHDIVEMADGNLMLTVRNRNLKTIDDALILLDRKTGELVRTWDLNQSVPRNYELMRDTVDWLHVNAVDVDERDRGLVVSGQRRGLFKVSWTNELVWILSDPKGFDGSAPLLDMGGEAFWGQHDIRIDEKNDVYYVFDNGLGRNYSGSEIYSRGVKFRVDQTTRRGVILEQWGKEFPEFYSPIVSGIDYSEDGNTLINFGSIGFNIRYEDPVNWRGTQSLLKRNPEYGSAWVEYNARGEVELQMRFSKLSPAGEDRGMYRARYLDLFPGPD